MTAVCCLPAGADLPPEDDEDASGVINDKWPVINVEAADIGRRDAVCFERPPLDVRRVGMLRAEPLLSMHTCPIT